MTPEGLKSGSIIIESKFEDHIRIGDMGGGTWHVNGEAVFVDLGSGKNLIVTLTNNASGCKTSVNAAILPFSQGSDLKAKTYPANWREVVRLGTRNIALANLPTTVTFTDINNPETVKLVDPRNLAATFGEGYGLKRAVMDVTNSAVTKPVRISRINNPNSLR